MTDRDAKRRYRRLREFALGFPGAYEEFPWGESVAKVNKKVFVFLGVEPGTSEYPPGITVKLRESHEPALTLDNVSPAGYGLGRSGWVDVELTGDSPPIDVLRDWIDESYRIVAPKRLVAELDARNG